MAGRQPRELEIRFVGLSTSWSVVKVPHHANQRDIWPKRLKGELGRDAALQQIIEAFAPHPSIVPQ